MIRWRAAIQDRLPHALAPVLQRLRLPVIGAPMFIAARRLQIR